MHSFIPFGNVPEIGDAGIFNARRPVSVEILSGIVEERFAPGAYRPSFVASKHVQWACFSRAGTSMEMARIFVPMTSSKRARALLASYCSEIDRNGFPKMVASIFG